MMMIVDQSSAVIIGLVFVGTKKKREKEKRKKKRRTREKRKSSYAGICSEICILAPPGRARAKGEGVVKVRDTDHS